MYTSGPFYHPEINDSGIPLWFPSAILLLFFCSLCFFEKHARKIRTGSLSADSIKEAVDTLPAALLISNAAGTVLLSNLKMNALHAELTKEPLTNARAFTAFVKSAGKCLDGKQLLQTASGRVWLFEEKPLQVNGRDYTQLLATDMTQQYRITEELNSKNKHLTEVQARIRSVSLQERSLVTAREIMNARMTVHNQMGNVLLAGKYYLDHPENTDEQELLRLLKYNTYFLLGQAEQPEKKTDAYTEAVRAAEQIGITVQTSGLLPDSGSKRLLLACAIVQCSANAVRHANGTILFLTVFNHPDSFRVEITNNGTVPKEAIWETGGLAALRKKAKAAGFTMIVESSPVFKLILTTDSQTL